MGKSFVVVIAGGGTADASPQRSLARKRHDPSCFSRPGPTIGEEAEIDAKMKAQGRERDDLTAELATLPEGSNVVLHPSAIKRLADKLRGPRTDWLHSPRAKLAYVLGDLDDMGELQPIVRELIRSVTVSRDEDDGRLTIKVEATLDPFLQGKRSIPWGGHGGRGGETRVELSLHSQGNPHSVGGPRWAAPPQSSDPEANALLLGRTTIRTSDEEQTSPRL